MIYGRTQRILLVEDNPAHAQLVSALLVGTPCEQSLIDHVPDLASAFDFLATNEVDLVLLDLGLPESRGIETFKTFREHQPQPPVVVLTSLDDETIALQAVNMGAEDYLAKDDMAGHLCRTIQHAIERSKLYRQLKEREIQLETIFKRSPDGLAVIDSHSRIIFGNPVAKRLLDNVCLDKLCALIAEDAFLHAPIELENNCGTGNTEQILEIHGAKILWEGQHAYLISLRDITPRRELEDRVHRSQKLEMVGTLASGLAHDFNNILSIALGHGQLVKTMIGDNSEALESIDCVLEAMHRGENLVRDLLQFSRPTGRSPVPFSINDLLTKIDGLIGSTLRKTHRVTITLASKTLYVNGISSQLEQAFLNLLINARDATPDAGDISVNVDTMTATTPFQVINGTGLVGNYVKITVADTGAGIEPDQIEKLFEPFYTTKGKGKGTGLGLFVVYSIVTQNNGFITVESRPGVGATFSILLPQVPLEE